MAITTTQVLPPCCNITSDKTTKLYCHLGCCDPNEFWYKSIHEDTCNRLKSFSSKLLAQPKKKECCE